MQIYSIHQSNSSQYKTKPKSLHFKGYTSEFGKELKTVIQRGQANETEQINLVEQLRKILASLTPDKQLGEGAHGIVYKIDDDFCLKVPRGNMPVVDKLLEIPSNIFKTLKNYYGNAVAKFNDVTIMKNVSSGGEHIPVGIPENVAIKNIHADNMAYYEMFALPRIADMPQKSFDEVAKDCAELNKLGDGKYTYKFDYRNPNNFVIVGDSIRTTDDIERRFGNRPNSIADLLNVFINTTFLNCRANYSSIGEPLRRNLMEKIILAGMKNDLPLTSGLGSDEILWYTITEDLCKLKTPTNKIMEKLTEIKAIPDAKKRIELTKEYLGKIMKD